MDIIIKDDWDIPINSSNVAGTIFFSVSGHFFPCFNYSDFPLVCIISWLGNLQHFFDRNNIIQPCETKLFFFDGPYTLQIILISKRKIQISFYDREMESMRYETNISTFCNLIIRKTELLIQIAEDHNIQSNKIREQLEGFMIAVRHYL